MSNTLKGKVAVITGSGRGIGRATAMAMAQEGAKVVINDLGCNLNGISSSSMIADEVVSEITKLGGSAVANYDSVALPEGASNIVKTAIDNFGKIDILVNNAGIMRGQSIFDMTDEEWDSVIKTNLYGGFYCTRAALVQMKKAIDEGTRQKGRIINITSHAGIKGNPRGANYSAAKMGVIGFTYSCALALWKYGITCNAVAPHAYSRFSENDTEQQLRALAKARSFPDADILPFPELRDKFLGSPDVIAPIICWLASEYADNITGQIFMARRGRVGVFSGMNETKVAYKDGDFDLDDILKIMPFLTNEIQPPSDWQ